MSLARHHDNPTGNLLAQQFSALLASRLGLHFPEPRWPDLWRGIERAAREFAQPGAEACMRWLLNTPLQQAQIEILASHLTVGETYFYREPAVFAALEEHILPPLIAERRAGNRNLRLWSAGCCTGEEAYSLAILLCRLLPDLEQWNVSILATDINPHFLARAQSGNYRAWSFRSTPAWFRDGYFSADDHGNYQLQPRIRELVRFAYLNLIDDRYPAIDNDTDGIDLVLCRNVLMYFNGAGMQQVLDKLHRALRPDGWLALSATESSSTLLAGFSPTTFGEATLYRKQGERTAGPATPPAAYSPPQPETRLRSAPACAWPPTGTPAAPSAARPGSGPAPSPPASDADAAYRQALAQYERGDYAEAAASLSTAAADDARGQALAARAWANLGQLEAACRCAQAAVAADKFDAGRRYLLATLLAEQGSIQAAVATLRQALYLDPDFILAHFALANLYRRLEQAPAAARHLATTRQLLAAYPPEALLPEGEGLNAGRLLASIDHTGGLS
jgi:chemotaxis protein methyltransferase CheR